MNKFIFFDFVETISLDIVAIKGNSVEATINFVERIVRLVAFDNVASILLLVWTGLKAQVTRKHEFDCFV